MPCLLASGRMRAACGPVLPRPAVLLVLALGTTTALAPAPALAGPDPEVGGLGTAGDSTAERDWPLATGLEAGLQYLVFSEDDMNDTYGGLPLLAVRLSMQTGRNVRVVLGTGYGRAGGDPDDDQADFQGDDEATLHVIPFQMGLRINPTPEARLRLNLGFVLEMTWVRETLPASLYRQGGLERTVTHSGWTRGIGATFGPEWRLSGSAAAFGLEAVVTGNSGDIGHDPDHQVNLSGMGARLYFTTGL